MIRHSKVLPMKYGTDTVVELKRKRTYPAKARGTVRPAECCRLRVGACPEHTPNVKLEVRQRGKWVHMGVLTPEHEWIDPRA